MKWVMALLVAAVIGLASAAPAWAQVPPKPGPPKRPGNMIIYGSYIAVGVLMLCVCVAAFKPAKRSHQD